MPVPAGFLEALRETGCPLDPERACRLISRTKAAWEVPGSRFVAVRIRLGSCRARATIMWDCEAGEPVAVVSWSWLAPKTRAPRDRFGHPGERGRPVVKFRMSEVE